MKRADWLKIKHLSPRVDLSRIQDCWKIKEFPPGAASAALLSPWRSCKVQVIWLIIIVIVDYWWSLLIMIVMMIIIYHDRHDDHQPNQWSGSSRNIYHRDNLNLDNPDKDHRNTFHRDNHHLVPDQHHNDHHDIILVSKCDFFSNQIEFVFALTRQIQKGAELGSSSWLSP